jgi:hypothetical protein
VTRSLWKLTPEPTVDEAHFEARLRRDVEDLRRDARRVAERAMQAATAERCRHGQPLCEHMRCASHCDACLLAPWPGDQP